jgi:hypothetical protein
MTPSQSESTRLPASLLYVLAALAMCAAATTSVEAQTPLERAALEREVQRGGRLFIEYDQQVVVGSARALSGDTIEVVGDAGVRQLRLTEVDRIYREGDSIWSGYAIGAAVLGTWCAIICGQGLNSTGGAVGAVMVNAFGFGGGIGALLDWSNNGTTTLFRKRQPTVRVEGMVAPRTVGLSAQPSWP